MEGEHERKADTQESTKPPEFTIEDLKSEIERISKLGFRVGDAKSPKSIKDVNQSLNLKCKNLEWDLGAGLDEGIADGVLEYMIAAENLEGILYDTIEESQSLSEELNALKRTYE